jgi:hypothetical protein
MDVAKSLVLRAAAVLLGFASVLAVATETQAQFTSRDSSWVKLWINYALSEYTALGGFTPNSGQMMTGNCATAPVFVTNGVPSSLRYVQNTSSIAGGNPCTFQLQCYSGDCTAGGTTVGPLSPPLYPKDSGSFPFRLFGFACPASADMICLSVFSGSDNFRLQAEPGPQ